MRVLGIETTCDETSAAIVQRKPDGGGEMVALRADDDVDGPLAA